MVGLNLTPQRTEMFDSNTARNIRQSHAGMAHFAGTSPAKAICRECQFFPLDKDFPWNGQRCGKYLELAVGKKAKDKVPAKTPACKYFEARK